MNKETIKSLGIILGIVAFFINKIAIVLCGFYILINAGLTGNINIWYMWGFVAYYITTKSIDDLLGVVANKLSYESKSN